MLLVPQTAAATWRVLVPWFASYFPLVLSLTLFTSRDVFFLFYFQLVFFKCLQYPLREGTTICFSCFFPSSSSRSICLCFYSLFSFVSLFHRMCISCLSYPVSCHGNALSTVFTA